MKKILLIVIMFTTILALSACGSETDLNPSDNTEDLGTEESLATLSYLSTGFLDFSSTTVMSSSMAFLGAFEEEETEIEGELDEVNVYIDRLKVLIDNGVEDFGSVQEEASDNELYTFKLTFTVNEEVYIIYYNVDEDTAEMDGVIVIGEVEYEFEVYDNIRQYEFNEEGKPGNQNNDNANKKDDDTTEDDNEDVNDEIAEDDNETKMILIATNGLDSIKIIYKSEVEEDESTTKFYVEQNIGGVEKELSLKISDEENETKVTIFDGENEFSFKREVEEDGVVYKLQYEVDGVRGMVKITEVTDEEGNVTYDYFIQEAGRNRHVEREEPKSNGFDDEEEDEEEA